MKIPVWLSRLLNFRRPTTSPVVQPDIARQETTYSSDQPIRTATDDRFARAVFATRVADTIIARKDSSSLVLGLYGAWGDGKTSVLYMIEERLRLNDALIPLRFNPWHFASEDQLIRGFFDTLATAIGENLKTRGEQIGEALDKYGTLLTVASASISGGLLSINPGQAAKDFGRSMSTVELDTLKGRIGAMLSASGTQVVVLIDDIDRLDKTETHAIFKLVKLSAGFEHTTYLLAFDADVVAAALGERYGSGGHAAGHAFLEKIIQVPLHLPPADPTALRRFAYEGVDAALTHAGIELAQSEVDTFTVQFMSGLEARLDTPRQARLYSNALMFALPIVKGEVNTVEFMLVEGLRVFYPKLYSVIRDNPSAFLGSGRNGRAERESSAGQLIEEASADLTVAEREQLAEGLLRHLFPRMGNMHYGSEWESTWAEDRRICSQAYFRRYFSYGIPQNDVSDRLIDSFLAELQQLEAAEQNASLDQLATAAPDVFVRKLRQREKAIPEATAKILMMTLARSGNLFPVERGPFVLGGTRAQAAILIAHLLRRISDRDVRVRKAEEVIRDATPVAFAMECLRWMSPGRDAKEDDYLVPQEVLDRLGLLLAERIRQADEHSPLYIQFGSEARSLYWYWHVANPAEVSARILARLDQVPEDIDRLLDVHTREAWGLETGLPSRADFSREDYDSVSRLTGADEIARRLRARYGAELDAPQYHPDSDLDVPRRIAHQFVFVHLAAQGGEDGQGDEGEGGQEAE